MEMKEKIALEALKLFRERGYANVTVADICEHLNIGRSGFYYHFKSKDAVVDSYMDVVLSQQASTVFDDEELSFRDRFIRLYNSFSELLFSLGPEVVRLTLRRQVDGQIFNFAPRDNPAWQKYCDIIKEGQLAGEITSEVDYQEIAEYLLYSGIGITAVWCNKNGNFDVIQQTTRVIDMVFNWKK